MSHVLVYSCFIIKGCSVSYVVLVLLHCKGVQCVMCYFILASLYRCVVSHGCFILASLYRCVVSHVLFYSCFIIKVCSVSCVVLVLLHYRGV